MSRRMRRNLSMPVSDSEFLLPLTEKRSGTELGRTLYLMRDGQWRTLAEIVALVGGTEAGVSARLRDLTKPEYQEQFGDWAREHRPRGDPKAKLYEYRLVPSRRRRNVDFRLPSERQGGGPVWVLRIVAGLGCLVVMAVAGLAGLAMMGLGVLYLMSLAGMQSFP
jgi:hypothetical protein